MDIPPPAPPQPRDIVYCHGCENEWYRDEGGLECPDCHSDFTEIIEPNHDPRDDDQHIPADDHPLHDHNPWNAPDPDEDDIDHFNFQRNEQGEVLPGTYRATINRTIDLNAQGQPIGGQGQGGGGLMGMIGNALGGLIGPALQQYQQQQQRGPGMPTPAEAQGPPYGEQQQQQGNNGTFTRQMQGPGYSFTITSSTTGGGNLFPRNANGPQPFQNQPDQMDDMLRQMMQNIGAFPRLPGVGGGGQRQGPGGFMFDDDDHMHPGGQMPFPQGLLGLLGMAGGGGIHGDAVYSQEALDRIVTQLMEQHQAGNAPGPASETAISSLPTRQLTQEDFSDDGKADCSICMEDKQLGDSVTVLPCGHWFDKDCVREWLKTHDTCPHCRQGIMPKEQQGSSNPTARQASQAPMNDMTNPPMPGGFPNANAGPSSGSGTRDSPFNVRDSPGSSRGGRPSAQDGNSGIFGSMRNAFGGGGNSSGGRS